MANEFIARKGLIVSGSTNISGSVTASNIYATTITGSLFGTSSWAHNAISSSYALTASYALNSENGGSGGTNLTIIPHQFIGDGTTTGFILSSSYNINSLIVNVDGLTYAPTDDYSVNTTNLSFVSPPPSGSTIFVRALIDVTSGSVGTFSGSFLGAISSASIATTSSYALTASYAINAQSGGSGAGFPFSGSAVITGSLRVLDTGSVGGITGSVTGSITGSFKGDGSQLTNLDINTAVISDVYKFVGNGSTTTYILSQSYLENSVQVSVQGLTLTNGVDYTYSTGSINFVITPPSSSNILVRALLNTQTNLSGSFSGSFIGDGRGINNIPLAINIETHKYSGDGSTTTYALGYPYGPHSLFVTVNGVTYVSPEDFTTSGNDIIFTEVPISQSNILIRAFVTQSGIGSASFAVTSSYATTALTASNALTASFALNAQSGGSGAGFPFSGSAIITGSLYVINTGSVGGITGSFSGSGVGLSDLRTSLAIDTYVFTGNGTETNYILSQSYTANSLIVTVEGIGYINPDDYTLSGPTMSFVAAPPTQSNILVKAFLSVSSGSYINYTGSFIGDGYGLDNLRGSLAIEENVFIGDGATTSYVVSSSYDPRSLIVTVGGLRYITPNDYTVTGSTINFIQAPSSQSLVVAQALLIVSSGSVGTFTGSFIGNAQLTSSGHFLPLTTDTYDLGSPSKKWRSLYVSGSTIYLGSLELKDNSGAFTVANSSGVTLPVSGTFTGSFFGTSSWADNAISSSYALSSSFTTTASYGVSASYAVSASYTTTGSYAVTSSYAVSSSYAFNATTASFASNVLKTKAGSVANTSFTGTPLTATVTFSTAFDNTNYAISITGEDSRAWIVQSKTASGFTINSVSNTALTGTTYWTCTAYGEN